MAGEIRPAEGRGTKQRLRRRRSPTDNLRPRQAKSGWRDGASLQRFRSLRNASRRRPGLREPLRQKAKLRSSGTNCRSTELRQEGQGEWVQQELAKPKRILYFRRSA